jgi:hypothetical protein
MAGEPAHPDVEEIKTVPYAPLSHPFGERLIGTIRRECLDRGPDWNAITSHVRQLVQLDREFAHLKAWPRRGRTEMPNILFRSGPSKRKQHTLADCGRSKTATTTPRRCAERIARRATGS